MSRSDSLPRRWLLVAVLPILAFSARAESAAAAGSAPAVLEVAIELADETLAVPQTPAIVRLERLGGLSHGSGLDASEERRGEADRVVEVEVPGTASVKVPGGSVWRVTLDMPSLWAPPSVWSAAERGRVTLRAVPTGQVAGTIVTSGGSPPFGELTARFQPADAPLDQPPPERYTVECAVAEGGRFRCAVPAGELDIRLRRPGFVSHHLWKVEVPPQGEVDAGTLRLVPGASVVAWVRSEGAPADFDVRLARAELSPETTGVEAIARDLERRRLLRLEAGPNARGFVEITGVSPGSYRLRVEHPDLADASFAPLVVAPGAETELREIVLRPPVALRVEVDPPTDSRRRPWLLTLSRESEVPGHLDRVEAGAADREGHWQRSGLAAGRYRLTVADGSGSRWTRVEVDLGANDREVAIELPFERVEGRVTLGGEPLQGATVWFGGRHGATHVAATTDAEGALYVFLPVRETWPIEVRAEKPSVVARLDAVEVRDHSAQPWRLVEVDLPSTGLTGEVVREDGGPIRRASVRLMREELPPRFYVEPTGEDGRFRIEALTAGEWRAQAEWTDADDVRWVSDGVPVTISEERVEEVRLVLRRPWTFSGQIADRSGAPVFGAEVTGVPEYPGRGERATYVASAITGLGGEFELQLPAEATAVRLTALPPGRSARQWPSFERGAPPQVLEVDPHGGTLRIVGLPSADAPAGSQPGVFGLDRWSLPTLVRWTRMNGGAPPSGATELVVPSMAAGQYTVCAPGRLPPTEGSAASLCVSGELLPYSELTLTVPAR